MSVEVNLSNFIGRIPAEEIYLKYGEINRIRYKKAIRSPLRPDKTPSFSFIPANNTVLWKDFASGESGNVITFVAKKLGLTNIQAIDRISEDFRNIEFNSSPEREYIGSSNNYELLHIPKSFTKIDEDYWTGRYYMPISYIKKEKIFAVQKVLIKTPKQVITKWAYLNSNPIYGYKFYDGSFKYYRPYGKKGEKFVQTSKSGLICYVDELGYNLDLIIMAKAVKDRTIFSYLGFNSICMIGERVIPSEENIKDILLHLSENGKLIYFGDNDITGKTVIDLYANLNINGYFLSPETECKDIPDYMEKHKPIETYNYINTLINA